MAADRRLLPHEWLFGGFLAYMLLRLIAAVGLRSLDALVFLVLIVVVAILTWRCMEQPTPRAWRLRLLFYPVAMNVVFQELRTAIPAITPYKADGILLWIDAALVGQTPSLALESWANPVVTELMSLCYIAFFPYLLFSLIWYFLRELDLLKTFVAGLFSLYGIGFLGYSLVPAGGPYLAMADRFGMPLHGGSITHWNAQLVRMGTNGVDVFPSLHCAVSLYLLLFDYRHDRRRFWGYLVPCVGLWLSTIYLRYHYLIDDFAGFALALLAIAIARRYQTLRLQGRLP